MYVNIPSWEKICVTVAEACELSGIGENSLREILKTEDSLCLHVGRKVLVKRRALEEFIMETSRI